MEDTAKYSEWLASPSFDAGARGFEAHAKRK